MKKQKKCKKYILKFEYLYKLNLLINFHSILGGLSIAAIFTVLEAVLMLSGLTHNYKKQNLISKNYIYYEFYIKFSYNLN